MSDTYTCLRCGRTSYNPNDLANRYCGACKRFEDDFLAKLIATEHLWRVVTPRFVAGLLVDAQGRIRRTAPIMRSWRGRYFYNFDRYALARGWQLTQLS